MTTDGFISLMENRPCIQDGLHVPECVLNHPELFVFERHILWRQARIGPEDPYAIEFGFLFDLVHVDGDAPALDLNELAVALVSNHGFCPALDLFLEDSIIASRSRASFLACRELRHTI